MFNRDKLTKLIVHRDAVPDASPDTQDVILTDYARSSGPRADETAILSARIVVIDGVKHYCLLDIDAYRYGVREIAPAVIRMAGQYGADRLYVERLSNWELLEDAIIRNAKERQVSIGRIVFFKPSKQLFAKACRMRRFASACDSGVVHFVRGNYIGKLFDQLQEFDFDSKTNRNQTDDMADCAALLVTHC